MDLLGTAVEKALKGELAQAAGDVKQAAVAFSASNQAKDDDVASLLEDLNGQVTQAVSKPEWFKKWGFHYLPSLRRVIDCT